MNLVPKAVSRAAHRQLFYLKANSPTILVATGIVGFGATAVLAARATRHLDDVLDSHDKARNEIQHTTFVTKRSRSQAIIRTYSITGYELTKLYGPSLVVGTLSTASILAGHNILRQRHLATVAAYSTLFEQFGAYRRRVAQTLGETAEQDIYRGAHGEYMEDPERPGEYKMQPVWDEMTADYLHPWFNESNPNWKLDPVANYTFLKAVEAHANIKLGIRGHVTLNDVLDDLGMPRCREGMISGWVSQKNGTEGDGVIDFGITTSNDPNTMAFCDHKVRSVQLNFNIDGLIVDKI